MKHAIRYLLALLWHLSVPAFIGYSVALCTATYLQIEMLMGLDAYFAELLKPLVTSCAR